MLIIFLKYLIQAKEIIEKDENIELYKILNLKYKR